MENTTYTYDIHTIGGMATVLRFGGQSLRGVTAPMLVADLPGPDKLPGLDFSEGFDAFGGQYDYMDWDGTAWTVTEMDRPSDLDSYAHARGIG